MTSIADYLREAQAELEDEGDFPADPEEAAEVLVRRVRSNTDHLANRPSTEGVRKAATAMTGATFVSGTQGNRLLEEDAERRSLRGRARRARNAGGTAARRTRGARRTTGAILRSPAKVISGPSSPRGLIASMFGLVVLYWLLRTASRTPGADFLKGVVSGARKPFEWLFSTGGVGAVEGPPASTSGSSSGPSATEILDSRSEVVQPDVEKWRPLVRRYFPAGEVTKALRVIYCESRGNPDAVNASSGASGLFQHLPIYWSQRSQAAGFAGASIFDPEANVATAAWLMTRDGWRHWPNCGRL